MKRRLGWLIGLALLAPALIGCGKILALIGPRAGGGSADLSVCVAIGANLSAGVQSGGLVDRHQQRAFPYVFAKQAGAAAFTIPRINFDGYPALLQLISLSPLVINRSRSVPGGPTNLGQPTAYHNMSVPGALLLDAGDSTDYYGGPFPRDPLAFATIVRHRGTILSEAASLNPTFLTIEYGSNEVVGPATQGSGAAVVSGATFATLLTGTMNALAPLMPNAKFAIFNVPDVTSLPFVTTFPPYVLDATGHPVIVGSAPVMLIGSESGAPSPLAPDDFVLLTAGDSMAVGNGFPIGTFSYVTGAPGNGKPLLDSQVLSHAEAAQVAGTIANYNLTIDSVATGRGGALVDLNGLYRTASTTGFNYQGTRYTNAFVTGGLFSLDGVHPNDLMHGIIANALIDAVNAKFGAGIPHVDLASVATASSSRMRPAKWEGAVRPWIQNAESVYGRVFPWRGDGSSVTDAAQFPRGINAIRENHAHTLSK